MAVLNKLSLSWTEFMSEAGIAKADNMLIDQEELNSIWIEMRQEEESIRIAEEKYPDWTDLYLEFNNPLLTIEPMMVQEMNEIYRSLYSVRREAIPIFHNLRPVVYSYDRKLA